MGVKVEQLPTGSSPSSHVGEEVDHPSKWDGDNGANFRLFPFATNTPTGGSGRATI
jgi:hypothetical protein